MGTSPGQEQLSSVTDDTLNWRNISYVGIAPEVVIAGILYASLSGRPTTDLSTARVRPSVSARWLITALHGPSSPSLFEGRSPRRRRLPTGPRKRGNLPESYHRVITRLSQRVIARHMRTDTTLCASSAPHSGHDGCAERTAPLSTSRTCLTATASRTCQQPLCRARLAAADSSRRAHEMLASNVHSDPAARRSSDRKLHLSEADQTCAARRSILIRGRAFMEAGWRQHLGPARGAGGGSSAERAGGGGR